MQTMRWPDGTECLPEEIEGMTHMSDDFERVEVRDNYFDVETALVEVASVEGRQATMRVLDGLYDGSNASLIGTVHIPENQPLPTEEDIIEIRYDGIREDYTIINPVFVRIVPDADPNACGIDQFGVPVPSL